MRFIDLTHQLEDEQPAFPGDPTPRIKPFHSLSDAGYNTTRFALGSHQGTHLDAPFHFFRDGVTVDRIPLETLHGPATLADLAPGGELGRRAVISAEMLAAHEAAFQPGARVIYRTGWESRFGDRDFYEKYPSLTSEAAEWIAARGVALLGMDTPSPAEDYEKVHKSLLGAGVIVIEGLTNLAQLPGEFVLSAFPLKLKGRDGAPIRAVAMVD
jgi:kynurenine formamidase